MHRGAGVTSLCLAVSNFLANKQFSSVAYLEVNSTNEIHNLNTRNKTNHFKYLGIDFYSAVTLDDLSSLLQEKYDYLVLDFGVTNQYTNLEFMRCDLKLAICDLSSWHKSDLISFTHNYLNNMRENIIFLGNPDKINQNSSTYEYNRVIKTKILRIPFFENPFQLTSQYFGFLKKITERN